jgi:DNA-binding Lrp family transcriptional regulator
MTTLDPIDAKILSILSEDGRMGVVELARRAGVARGTAQARLDKLRERGVITGFGPSVDPAAIGFPILAFVHLEIVQGKLDDAVSGLARVPELLEAYGTSGPRDLLCRVVARDTEHLQDVLNRILQTPSVRRTTTYLGLSTQIVHRTTSLLGGASG